MTELTELTEYLFDVTVHATVAVEAKDEHTARTMLATQLRLTGKEPVTGVEINHISWRGAEPPPRS